MRFDLKCMERATLQLVGLQSLLDYVAYAPQDTTVVRKNSKAGLAQFNEIWKFGGLPVQKTCHST